MMAISLEDFRPDFTASCHLSRKSTCIGVSDHATPACRRPYNRAIGNVKYRTLFEINQKITEYGTTVLCNVLFSAERHQLNHATRMMHPEYFIMETIAYVLNKHTRVASHSAR